MILTNRLRKLNKSILILTGILISLNISAQESGTQESENVLEEITVTARKREVNIQEAPIAVSAVSGDDFVNSNIVKLDNFNGYVPGLVISKNDGAGRVVSIRGVGWETAQSLSTQPSVLVYIDGVYLANPLSMGLDLGEVERIEVFRGPQGTEFGQGATGGAINIITKKPHLDHVSGSVSLGYGDYNHLKETGDVNLPLGEHFAIRASIQNYERDGYAEIKGGALDGYQLDDGNSTSGNLSLLWAPDDQFSVRLSGFLNDSDQNGAAQKHILDPNPNARELSQDYPSTFSLENQSFSATIEWKTPWGFTLKSLTGYQELEKRQSVDGDRLTEELTAIDLNGFGPANFDVLPFWDNNSSAFSQELNLTKYGEKWDWILGAYYLDHENDNFFLEAVGQAPMSQYQEQLDNPTPENMPAFVPPLQFVENRSLTRKDTALYAQATYRANDRMAFTFGGRYQRDKSVDDAVQFWFIESHQELDDNAFTWKLGTDFQFTEDNMAYILVSTGWKNGGNNPGAANGGALDVPEQLAPEEVTSFELGSKNIMANRKVRLNASVFYYDYDNYQFTQEDPIPFSGGTGNIPSVTIYGLETELSWQINHNLRFDGNLAMMDGNIEDDQFVLDVIDFANSGFGRFTATGVEDRASLRRNIKNNEPPKLVDLTSRLTLTHHHAFGNGSVLTSRLDYIYRGEYQYRVYNHPEADSVPSYNTLGLFFGYDLAGLPLSLNLSATNLTDEDGVNSRFANPYGVHTISEEFIPPRELFATFRYTF